MGLEELAKRLADRKRMGMTDELADKLRLVDEDVMHARLRAMIEGSAGPLGVYLLSAYVIDDTDFWSDGEIYWWTIPVLAEKGGRVRWSAQAGLPMGAPPHSVGSQEWMTNFSLAEPPLIAAIAPDEELDSLVFRIAFYDDDGALADCPKAMAAGYEALAACKTDGLTGPDQIISPVRDAIFRALRAEQDDILIDQDVTLRRGEATRFNAGFVGSVVNNMIMVYYFVRDELRTEQAGPIALRKNQSETISFKSKLERGGRLSVFARGAEVNTSFGDLSTEVPFVNRVLDERTAAGLDKSGFTVTARGPAKVIAYYTPPG